MEGTLGADLKLEERGFRRGVERCRYAAVAVSGQDGLVQRSVPVALWRRDEVLCQPRGSIKRKKRIKINAGS